jgi:NADH dehydrogenase/NADH:ubiquinone oxidoreductase subunit G
MTDMVNLIIDQQNISVSLGTTILKAAESIGITIPTICFHDYCTANALCRICVVEVEGSRVLVPACVGKVSQGMVVRTQNDRIQRARRTILEMLDSTVDLSNAPDIQELITEYKADPNRFPGALHRSPQILDDNSMYIRDYEKCILCWRCVQVCAEDAQYTFAINFTGRGFNTSIGTFFDKPMPETSCVFCGQCVGVCPTGALKPKREWLLETGHEVSEIVSLSRPERSKQSKTSSSAQ